MNSSDNTTTLPTVPAGQQGPSDAIGGLVGLWTGNAIVVSLCTFVLGAALMAVTVTWFRRRGEPASGARLFYLVALMCTAISANTSWRFFRDILHIENVVERTAMFAVIEAALIACAYAMRANVNQGQPPGAARTVAWALAGLAGYMALIESGPFEGLARVALGPVLGIVTLHLALGIELRQQHHELTGTWARVLSELRERALSWLGVADEQRDALERSRDRHARRAARLALAPPSRRRNRRLQKALRKSNVAHDAAEKERLLAELAVLRHAADLADLNQPSPWLPAPAGVGGPAPVNNGHSAIERPPALANGNGSEPIVAADTGGLGERTPDTPADTETTVVLAAVSSDVVAADTATTSDSKAMSELSASLAPQPETPRGEHSASMNGHRPASPPERFRNDSDDPDETVNGHSDQPILVRDQRIRDLANLLADGQQLTGTEVAAQYGVNPRTGQRWINKAKEVLSAQQSRQLEAVGEQ